MPDTIPPALSAEEWKIRQKNLSTPGDCVFLERTNDAAYFGVKAHDTWRGERYTGAVLANKSAAAAIIALANAALPPSDPRKITWTMVEDLCLTVAALQRLAALSGTAEATQRDTARLKRIADALASYLPPRET